MALNDATNGVQNGGLNTLHTPLELTRAPTPANGNGSANGAGGHGSGIVVFSGGSAANNLVDVFNGVREANRSTLSYVIPISDNGGSSSELIRVFGGPGIGDVRSRLVRLIPQDGEEATAIKHFFNYRLPTTYQAARSEWHDIIEASHSLWTGISTPKKELIRSVLNAFNIEMLKRLRPTSRFDFSGASIGNLFLTGARLFTGSFEAAIYLLSSVCAVPSTTSVLPAINSNFAHHIAAGLTNNTVITGQNNISHPSEPTAAVPQTPISTGRANSEAEEQDKVEDANMPGTLPTLRKPAIAFSKDHEEDLPARIVHLWYINPYGQEIKLPANPRVIDALGGASSVVYSIGSLFTSIIPSLILRGVGEAIAKPSVRTKILILNGTLDRETGPSTDPYTALDFVAAIANACAESRGLVRPHESEYWMYVSHIVYLDGTSAPKDANGKLKNDVATPQLDTSTNGAATNRHGTAKNGTTTPKVDNSSNGAPSNGTATPTAPPGPPAPKVDKAKFHSLGIETMRLYGPKDANGVVCRYDDKALQQTLQAIIGRKDLKVDKTRRNTLIG